MAWWVWLWDEIDKWAFLGVVLALAIEFAALRLGAPYKKILESAKDLKIAELNNETARLRKQIGPRQIDSDKFMKALEGKPKAPIEIMFPKENGEAFLLALQFRDLLRKAGWQASEPIPVPLNDIPRLANQPSHIAAGGEPIGIGVVVRADTNEEFEQFGSMTANSPAAAIFNAISQTFGGAAGHTAGPNVLNTPPRGTVRIVVGPKP